MTKVLRILGSIFIFLFLFLGIYICYSLQSDFLIQLGLSYWLVIATIIFVDGSKVLAEIGFFYSKGLARTLLGIVFSIILVISGLSTFSVRVWKMDVLEAKYEAEKTKESDIEISIKEQIISLENRKQDLREQIKAYDNLTKEYTKTKSSLDKNHERYYNRQVYYNNRIRQTQRLKDKLYKDIVLIDKEIESVRQEKVVQSRVSETPKTLIGVIKNLFDVSSLFNLLIWINFLFAFVIELIILLFSYLVKRLLPSDVFLKSTTTVKNDYLFRQKRVKSKNSKIVENEGVQEFSVIKTKRDFERAVKNLRGDDGIKQVVAWKSLRHFIKKTQMELSQLLNISSEQIDQIEKGNVLKIEPYIVDGFLGVVLDIIKQIKTNKEETKSE